MLSALLVSAPVVPLTNGQYRGKRFYDFMLLCKQSFLFERLFSTYRIVVQTYVHIKQWIAPFHDRIPSTMFYQH